MKEIHLTKGKKTKVDDEDYDFLNAKNWSAWWDRKENTHFYATRSEKVGGKWRTIRMHREIMKPPEGLVVDHINRDSLDNRKINLRICTQRENLLNRKDRDLVNGSVGVTWDARTKKWLATISLNKKNVNLGRYFEKDTARAIYAIMYLFRKYYYGVY